MSHTLCYLRRRCSLHVENFYFFLGRNFHLCILLFAGVAARFSFLKWLKSAVNSICRYVRVHWTHFVSPKKQSLTRNCFYLQTSKEEQGVSGRDGDHALSVRRRAENQAADGGEQRLCLSPPAPPVFLYHGGRNGAATPAVTLAVSVVHVSLSSASQRRTTRSPHFTQREDSAVSLSRLVKCDTKQTLINKCSRSSGGKNIEEMLRT